MAKNKVSEWSSTPANNTDISGINIAEGCAPSGINNAIRELMAQLKDQQVGTDADNFTVGGNLSVTGTSTFTGAVSITSLAADLPITEGGTGASTAANARANLGTVADTASNGIAVRTSANTLTARTVTAGTSVTVTNGDGVSGNPTVAVSNDGITATQLASNAVTTAKIADANITAAKLNGAQSGSAPIYGARAFGSVSSTGTLTSGSGSNIATSTRVEEGRYSVTFTTAMPSSVYTVVGSVIDNSNGIIFNYGPATTTGFDVTIRGDGGGRVDDNFSFAVFA